jgi:hypothetical protein
MIFGFLSSLSTIFQSYRNNQTHYDRSPGSNNQLKIHSLQPPQKSLGLVVKIGTIDRNIVHFLLSFRGLSLVVIIG